MPIIKSKKFILRPLKREDAANIAKYANDKTVYKNTLVLPYPYTINDAKGWISRNLVRYKAKKKTDYVFAIEIEGKFAGAIGIHKIIEGHKAELGYWLGRKYWG